MVTRFLQERVSIHNHIKIDPEIKSAMCIVDLHYEMVPSKVMQPNQWR